MLTVIQAPEEESSDDKYVGRLFLAGGISNCPDWQTELLQHPKLKWIVDAYSLKATVFNPRRIDFNMNDPNESVRQINWEFRYLQKCDKILFWFPKETLCPITLFEYGKWIGSNKTLFVGCHNDYARKMDLFVQTSLARPTQKIHTDFDSLVKEISERILN